MRARPVAHLAILGVSRVYLRAGTCPERTDCLAGHVGLELRNVVANVPLKGRTDLRESSRNWRQIFAFELRG